MEGDTIVESKNERKKISTFRETLPQVIASTVKNLPCITYGMGVGFPTILIPNLSGRDPNEPFKLTKEGISWLGAIMLICMSLGSLLSGLLTQSIGRKRALQLLSIPAVLYWLLLRYATEVWQIYAGLCISGVWGGLLEAPIITYVAEISQPHLRGILSSYSSLAFNFGILILFVLGTFLPWREVALVSCILPLVSLICFQFMPESPYWLIMKKRYVEARKSLAWLRGWTSIEDIEDEFQQLYQKSLNNSNLLVEETNKSKIGNYLSLLAKRSFLFPFGLLNLTFFILHFSGLVTLTTYAVEIFTALNTPIDEFFATIILGAVEFLGCLTCMCIIRYTGKRKLLFITTILAGICYLIVGLYGYFAHYNYLAVGIDALNITYVGDSAVTNPLIAKFLEFNWIPMWFLILCCYLTHCGIRIIPMILLGELFPTNIRSVASGMATSSGLIIAFISNKLFLQTVESITLPGTFFVYCGVCFIGTFFLYFVLPETEGKTLAEITDHFSGLGKTDNKIRKKQKTCNGIKNPTFKTLS